MILHIHTQIMKRFVEPNEFSEDIQSSQYFDNYSSNHYVASMPVKFDSYLQTDGKGEFGDPLEISDLCGITWYVYMESKRTKLKELESVNPAIFSKYIQMLKWE